MAALRIELTIRWLILGLNISSTEPTGEVAKLARNVVRNAAMPAPPLGIAAKQVWVGMLPRVLFFGLFPRQILEREPFPHLLRRVRLAVHFHVGINEEVQRLALGFRHQRGRGRC